MSQKIEKEETLEEFITSSTEEFIKNFNECGLGYTYECGINGLNTKRINLIAEMNEKLKYSGYGWMIHHCSTCAEHSDGENNIHLSIEGSKYCNYQEVE